MADKRLAMQFNPPRQLACRFSTLPLPSRNEPEVQVAAVSAPADVRQGEPFYVEVTIASNHADSGFIDVYRDDILTIEQTEPIKIEAGETKLRFRQTVNDEKQVDYAVRIRDFSDTLLDDNSASAVVFAAGKPTVLLIDSQTEQINELRWALEEQGIIVQVRPTDGIPQSLSELQRFDCVILSECSRERDVVATNGAPPRLRSRSRWRLDHAWWRSIVWTGRILQNDA